MARRKRSSATPVSSPKKIDVVVKKAITAPVETVAVETTVASEAEMAWREDVWAFRTTGGVGDTQNTSDVHPLVLDVWREDVVAGRTTCSLKQWLAQN